MKILSVNRDERVRDRETKQSKRSRFIIECMDTMQCNAMQVLAPAQQIYCNKWMKVFWIMNDVSNNGIQANRVTEQKTKFHTSNKHLEKNLDKHKISCRQFHHIHLLFELFIVAIPKYLVQIIFTKKKLFTLNWPQFSMEELTIFSMCLRDTENLLH